MHADKFIVINRTSSILQLIIPAPTGSGRFSASIELEPANTVDLVPFAGSVINCNMIPQVIGMLNTGALQLVEV